jgi:hypothetical protein
MRFGKLGLCGFGVVETQQRHTQIVMRMGHAWIEAHRFTITVGRLPELTFIRRSNGRKVLAAHSYAAISITQHVGAKSTPRTTGKTVSSSVIVCES